MDQSPAEFTRRLEDTGPLAAALGAPTDVLGDDAPEVGSTGAAHLLVPLVSAEAVDAVRPDPGALAAVLAEAGAEGCYVYTTAVPAGPVAAYARFFNPTVGIAEDAATGTAAGPLAALLVRQGLAPAGGPVVIEQGRALGRPSRIAVTVEDGRVTITGAGVLTGSGVLHLDG
jgi:PhzF family phenazine biosynthesis protein